MRPPARAEPGEALTCPMFEITADDIAVLNDENLRAVVARLCEAEVRRRGFSASYVTWGGNQNAADGGIDVRVALPPGSVTDGFVPRVGTGFQVKKQLIVSSEGSTSDSALTSRRDAMKEAMKGVANADALALDAHASPRGCAATRV